MLLRGVTVMYFLCEWFRKKDTYTELKGVEMIPEPIVTERTSDYDDKRKDSHATA